MKKWIKVGVVGVDSGRLCITDPCYLDEAKKAMGKIPIDHEEIVELKFAKGYDGLGVVVSTSYGDDLYEVFVRKSKDDRIEAVKINFL